MRCDKNKIYRNIRHNDTVIGFVSSLRKKFKAEAICVQNNNVLQDNLQPDIKIVHGGDRYIDITYVANENRLEEAFNSKIKRYGEHVIPVAIRYNGTIYDKSLALLRELKIDDKTWSNLYRHIYSAISKNWKYAERNCTHKVDMMIANKKMMDHFALDKDEEFADVIKEEEGRSNNAAGINNEIVITVPDINDLIEESDLIIED